MLSKVYNPALIVDLPLSVAIDYIIYALEQEKEQVAWDLWKGLYPFMQIGWLNHIRFSEFKDNLFERKYNYSQKSFEEVEKEMLAVVAAYEGR